MGRLAKRTCAAKKGLTAAFTEKYIKDVVALGGSMVRAGIQKAFFDMDHRADQKELERRWFARGYKAGGPGACNTWTVPSSRVS
ncbi:hypothetical protein ACFFV7_19895 [Nonomuraea spiralis]|uniref:Uncharacterized protein n=1 Tax=Nonomuraea spiralis TaxID=46182 RepID=A0ABV5IHF7_9ACTN|nr:hypothetical protein [Nonomuraea spiralis]GGT39036.1 hypothetical protein GCM10010176_098880 [Nonomuraea spiralis]